MGILSDYIVSAMSKVLDYVDKSRTGWINVKSYGAKGDGVTDDTEAISQCIANAEKGSVIYFPNGVYCLSSPIILSKNVQIYGDSKSSEIHVAGKSGRLVYPESVIKWIGTANNTMFTVGNEAYRVEISNLTFIADTYVVNDTGNVATEGNPAKMYEAVTLLENVNAIDLSTCVGDKSLINCAFSGFSGTAVILGQHKYVKDCSFTHCNVGVKCLSYDNIFHSCWWSKCSVGIYSEVINTIFVYGSWFDQMEQHAIKGDSQLMLHFEGGSQVDMCDYCAIYVPTKTLTHSRISGRFSRCGMYYAGTSNITDIDVAERYKAVCIYTHFATSCYFEITTHRREIGAGLGICPVCIFESDAGYQYCNIIDTSETNYFGREYVFKNSTVISGETRTVYNGVGLSTSVPTMLYRQGILPTANAFRSSAIGDMFFHGNNKDLYISTTANSKDDWVKVTSHGDGSTITEVDGVLSVSENLLTRISELETKIAELTT